MRPRLARALLALSGAAVLAVPMLVRVMTGPNARSNAVSSIAAAGAGKYEAASLFQLDRLWTTDAGQPFHLSELRGRVAVLAMIFTSCPSTCPTLVKEMQGLEQTLPAGVRGRVKFVLVSIDPEHDTPLVLARYRAKMELQSDHWLLLHGEPEVVRELSAALGTSYAAGGGAVPSHSRLVTVLDPEGEIVHQQSGAAAERQKWVDLIEHAENTRP